MRILIVLAVLVLGTVADDPGTSSRIVGGSSTVIEQYPFSAALLRLVSGNNFRLRCGGTILNNRAVLTAAHCVANEPVALWVIRVGSTNAHSGGVTHRPNWFIIHPNYRPDTLDSDLAIMRSATVFIFNNGVRPGSIAGAQYHVPDHSPVWAIGWGSLAHMGNTVEQLRHVQIRTVNQATCRARYSEVLQAPPITDNMMCVGMLDVGGRGPCQGDAGSPVLHGHVIVGVTSWGLRCGQPRHPSVSVRVNRFTQWILANA